MLETKIEFVNIDKTGRLITVQDTTGDYNAVSNPTGYGGPNINKFQIRSIIFELSAYDQSDYNRVRYVRSQDPDHPEWMIHPSVGNILNGALVDINSITLGITQPEAGLKAFEDGVIDLNMYSLLNPVSGVGSEGDIFITGTNLDVVFENVSHILVGEKIHQINHRIPTNEGTVLYLVEPLEEDITSFIPAYLANTKIYNATQSNCCITANAGKISVEESGCCGKCKDKKADTLYRLLMYKIVAQIDFNSADYEKANDLLKAAYRGCKSLNCKCK